MQITMMPHRLALFALSCVMFAGFQAAAVTADDAFLPGKSVTDANPYPVKMAAPMRAASTASPGTIAAPNAYQAVLPADPLRKGCSIQNKSLGAMRVALASPGVASDATAFDVPAGGTFDCTAGLLVITDPISIAAPASGGAFVVVRQ